MKIRYDPGSDVLEIIFQEGKYDISRDIPGELVVDYSEDGRMLSIEILNASESLLLEEMNVIATDSKGTRGWIWDPKRVREYFSKPHLRVR